MAVDPREAEQAWALLDALLKNPETRTDALRVLKKGFPKAAIPELDVAEPHVKRLDELNEKLDKLADSIKGEKEDTSLLSKLGELRTKRGYTDEGMEKIKQIMLDEKIANPDIAANHFDALQPRAEPAETSGYFPTSFIDESDKGVEPWFQNEDTAADQEIMAILRESRAGRVH